MEVSVKATVKITLLEKTLSEEGIVVTEGRGINVIIEDDYFPGRVLECERSIFSGETGEAVIGLFGLNTDSTMIQSNDRLLLRDGPVDIGYADVLTITIM